MSTPVTVRSDDALRFPLYTLDAAPAESRDALQRLEASVGAIPNLAATMAGSPALIQGFVGLREINARASGLRAHERELLFLANAVANECDYCRAVHALFASRAGVPADVIDAVRSGRSTGDARQDALVQFGRAIASQRARLEPGQLEAFLDAGFERRHALDVVACFAQSIMANYTNHLADVEFDAFLAPPR